MTRVNALHQSLESSKISDLRGFVARALQPLSAMDAEARRLADEVQGLVRPRAAEGSEVLLLEMIKQASGGQMDLRAIAVRLMDQGDQQLDLDAVIRDLESLFQKNQIAIYLSLLHELQ